MVAANRSKAKKAASKPCQCSQRSSQQSQHACSRLPLLIENETACFQQSPAHAELPPQTNADQSTVQAPVVQDQSRPVQQEGSSE